MTRRELLKGGLVAPVGLVVVASGIMDNDGQQWRQGWDGRSDATVFLYGRITVQTPEAHATPQQIANWIDREAIELKHSWVANHQKAMASRNEMRRLWQPNSQDSHSSFLMTSTPDMLFYEGK